MCQQNVSCHIFMKELTLQLSFRGPEQYTAHNHNAASSHQRNTHKSTLWHPQIILFATPPRHVISARRHITKKHNASQMECDPLQHVYCVAFSRLTFHSHFPPLIQNNHLPKDKTELDVSASQPHGFNLDNRITHFATEALQENSFTKWHQFPTDGREPAARHWMCFIRCSLVCLPIPNASTREWVCIDTHT